MTSSEIRSRFLDFFASKNHQILSSAPIVVKNDPTLLFINSGMAPFKDYFLGNRPAPYARIADTQKCLRVSGKHNDLEEVGVDTYHHTMFEMLGNWSFGDYFKKEAIAWSWELLTEVYGLDKDRLYVTVFEGDAKENLPFDEEAFQEWKKWIPENRILRGNKKDNFWEMGDMGPCGPCTEIHVDCRTAAERAANDGALLVNADHPQVIEIWNNVFMQFNRLKDGSLVELPAKHVDTGMGFERLVRVLQNKSSNYDTDIFTGTIAQIEKIVHKEYSFSDSKSDIAFRVICDHIRAIAFTIADGQLPSNIGAGYVIRRILRRAVRYYYTYLDYKQPLLEQLIRPLALQFQAVFPELKQQESFIEKVVREEEDSFLRTLEKGLKKIDEVIKTTDKTIAGKEAFELYDTYGFPIDLTRLIASENNLEVDEHAFELEMQQQKNRSRAATQIDTQDWVMVHPESPTSFIGYDDLVIDTHVVKYRKVSAKGKEQYQIVLEKSPFYAESGGQVGDSGTLTFGDETIFIHDTKKENNLNILFADHIVSDMAQQVNAKVDWEKRLYISYNHTATHLLHAALRQVLGAHVAQKGSLVNADILRFDFSHFSKMTEAEIFEVQNIVNQKIRENIPVVIREMPKDEAMQLGAMALFGEKYGDTVRVVTIDPNYSVELCGGTHVGNTGMIGAFIIQTETAVAAGVRRVEALTGAQALHYLADKVQQHKHLSELLKTKDPLKSIEKLLEDKNQLEKKLAALEQKECAQIALQLLSEIQNYKDIQFLAKTIDVDSVNALRNIATALKSKIKNTMLVLNALVDSKIQVLVFISEDLVQSKNWDASKIIKEIVAPAIQGGGGGQKTMALAAGTQSDNLNTAIEKIKALAD